MHPRQDQARGQRHDLTTQDPHPGDRYRTAWPQRPSPRPPTIARSGSGIPAARSSKPVPAMPAASSTPRRRPASTTSPTASDRRARRSTRSTRTTSCRCARSTTTASSSRKSRRVADGLGPTYNAQSCRECHQNVVTGGASQIAEHRTGRMERERVLRVARRLADPVARDASRHRRARRLRGRRPHLPHLDQHARRGLRRGDRQRDAARDPRCAAGGDARHARSWCRCSRPAARRASGASAGRASTPASNRSPPTPT